MRVPAGCAAAPAGPILVADSEPKESAPLPWLLLTGLLGVFAVGVPQSGNAPAPVAKKDEKKDGTDAVGLAMAADDPLKPVFDFHKSHDVTLDPEEEIRRNIHGYKTEFLIATVPDPIDSGYGYAFDQVVDAIQRAVEKKDGYILDRCWLPWELDRKAKPKPGDPPSNLRETKPGILLFRHGKDKGRKVDQPGPVRRVPGRRDADGRASTSRPSTSALTLMTQGRPPGKRAGPRRRPVLLGLADVAAVRDRRLVDAVGLQFDLRDRLAPAVPVPGHHRQRDRGPQERVLLATRPTRRTSRPGGRTASSSRPPSSRRGRRSAACSTS